MRSDISYEDSRTGLSYWLPISVVLGACLLAIICLGVHAAQLPETLEPYPELTAEPIPEEYMPKVEEAIEEETKEELPVVSEPVMTDRDYMAAVVMSEAGSEKFIGKVAVVTVILNRSNLLGTSIQHVVEAKNQFSYPYYGKITTACYEAVDYALENRDLFPKNLFYFRNEHYHDIGEPYIQIGNHYFSTLGEPEFDIETLGSKD